MGYKRSLSASLSNILSSAIKTLQWNNLISKESDTASLISDTINHVAYGAANIICSKGQELGQGLPPSITGIMIDGYLKQYPALWEPCVSQIFIAFPRDVQESCMSLP